MYKKIKNYNMWTTGCSRRKAPASSTEMPAIELNSERLIFAGLSNKSDLGGMTQAHMDCRTSNLYTYTESMQIHMVAA